MNKAIMLAAIPALAGSTLQHGKVYACQNSDMQNAHRLDTLEEYLFGLPESDAEAKLNSLFPSVEVGRLFQWYSVSGDAMTEDDNSDIRAMEALFKRLNGNPEQKHTDETIEKGLAMVIDRSKIGAHTTMDREKRRAVKQLKNRLSRIEYVRGLNLLDASATNVNKDWTAADADPDVDVADNVDTVGAPQDTVVYSRTAYNSRRSAYRKKDAANSVVADHARMGMTELADYLGVKDVQKDDLPIQNGKKGNKKFTTSDVVISYHKGDMGIVSAEEVDTLNPASVVRFYTPASNSEGENQQAIDGGKWGVLEYETERMTVVAVFHFSLMVATNIDNIKKVTNTAG